MNQSNLLTVRVAGVMNRQAVVLHAGRTLPCLLSGRLLRQKDSLAVGDRAEAEVLGGGQYRLTRILPRTSALRRPSRRGSGDALLAANADFVLAVCAAPALLRAFALPEWALEAAGAAEAVKSVVDYCTAHYGMLSFGSGDTLKLIQSRVTGGGYAANGASLLDEADFTADNLSDTGKGGGAGEVMIHELVHQWWGLGNMFDASDESSPWSAEGLTVYTTYRIVKERYGPSYAQEHYVDQWQQAVDNYYLNFYVRNPDYLEALPEEERLEISNSLRYVRQYCEMPLKILKAEQLVGGEEAMDRILRGLFNRELDPMYPYLTYQDFLNACGLTEEDLNLA